VRTCQALQNFNVIMSSIVPSTASTASRESSEFEFVSGGNKEAAAKMKEPPKAPQVQANTNPVSEVQEEPDGLFGWVKGSGGLFSKVAEKTKSSVESVIITLDPQMKDYIHSSGNFRVIVASENTDKVTAIKNAFHETFGLATVYGVNAQPKNVANQPVGFAAAKQGANERIQIVRHDHAEAKEAGSVLIAVENFLLEVGDEEWTDQGCIVLSDQTRQISLCAYTQPTPVPFSAVQKLQDATDENYPLSWSGFSKTIGSVMADHLKVAPNQWHAAACGVPREDLLKLAAKSLAHSYKAVMKAKVDNV